MKRRGDVLGLSELPLWSQFVVVLLFGGIATWAFFGEAISPFLYRYGDYMVAATLLIILAAGLFYIEFILPIDRGIFEDLRRDEELEMSRMRERLLEEKVKELEGLTEDERERRIARWIKEEYLMRSSRADRRI